MFKAVELALNDDKTIEEVSGFTLSSVGLV